MHKIAATKAKWECKVLEREETAIALCWNLWQTRNKFQITSLSNPRNEINVHFMAEVESEKECVSKDWDEIVNTDFFFACTLTI